MALPALLAGTAGLLLGPAKPVAMGKPVSARMACVDEFSISKEIKAVRVFDGGASDIATEIQEEVTKVAKYSIEEKGSFSIAIPGGSVVAAFGGLPTDAFDFTKTHVFFCNEKIPSYQCYEGAIDLCKKLGIPEEQVHGIGEGSAAEAAERYTNLLKTHPSIDNSGVVPSFDMMLLGTGGDGHCGCLFPDSDEIKATGSGKVVLAGNDERADGDFVAVSMDVMCATKVAIVSAPGSARAEMVAKAVSGKFGPYDCPAGMVEAREDTLWFTDGEGVEMLEFEDDDEEEEE